MTDSNWDHLRLHLWKNLNVHWNYRTFNIYAFLTPSFFGILLVLFRFEIPVQTYPSTTSTQISLELTWSDLMAEMQRRHAKIKSRTGKDVFNVYMPRNIIAYAPATYKAFINIMERAKADLTGIDLVAFDDCAKLRETMQTEFYFAGVCFNDTVMNISTETVHLVGIYPNHLTMSLVFPSELRIYNTTHISESWNTDKLYFIKSRADDVTPHRHPEGLISYLREGFVIIQHAVSLAYVGLISNKTKSELPEIALTHFPIMRREYDKLTDKLEIGLSFVIMTSFIMPVSYFLKFVLVEKENRTVRLMHLLYVRHVLQFSAWLVMDTAGLVVTSIPLLILLKIKWNSGFAILTYTSAFVVFQLFVAYSISTLIFTYTITNFFTHGTSGICVMSLVSITTYIPFLVIVNFRGEKLSFAFWIAYFFPNSVLGLGFRTILDYEVNNQVLDMKMLFVDTAVELTDVSLGFCTLLFYGQALFYASIALIIPEIHLRVVPDRVIRFFINYCSRHNEEGSETGSALRPGGSRTRVFQVEPNYKHILLEFINVTKEIDGEVLLHDITFNLYEDECTVLMGHNGAGKSLLMDIAIGITEPTSGAVYIKKSKMQDNMPSVRRTIGVCVSDGLVYDGLTVENQLTFYCRMRGLNEKDTEAEVRKFLKAMDLEDKRYVLTQNLTHSLRFHLALCTAMVGGTKIVLLEEPSAINDLSARKLMWELLYREKKGRTIFMITHSYTEAQSIADRVLILSHGTLQCSGTTRFLRNLYDQGYRMVLFKGPQCQSDEVTELFRKYIPNITPICDFGAELSYLISHKYEDRVVPLVTELNLYLNELDIRMDSLSEVTMEDVFFNVGADRPANGDFTRLKNLLNGIIPHRDLTSSYVFMDSQLPSKYQLWSAQWQAMLYKHYISLKFYWGEILACTLAIVICVFATFALFKQYHEHLPPITYDLKQYRYTETIVDSRTHKSELITKVEEMYTQSIFWYSDRHQLQYSPDHITEYMADKLKEDFFALRVKYVIAATFAQNNIVVWFNDLILHTAPLSLNMAFAALLRALLNSDAKIAVIFEPLPFSTERNLMLTESHLNFANFLGSNIAFCASYFGALALTYIIEERETRFKLLQLLSGLRLSTFWLSTFFFSLLRLFFGAVVVVLAMWFTSDEVFRLPYVLGSCFLVFIMAGIAMVCINFAFSFIFNNGMNAYILITTYHVVGSVAAFVLLDLYATDFNLHFQIPSKWQWIFRIFPLYEFYMKFNTIYTVGLTDLACQDKAVALISIELENCTIKPSCCEFYDLMPVNMDVGNDFISLIVMCFVGWIIVIWNESSSFWHWRAIPLDHEPSALEDYKKAHSLIPTTNDNSDIIYERIKVNSLSPQERRFSSVICQQAGIIYNNVSVLKRISFYLEPTDCFGVIGPNSCGKTTLLKLLAGDTHISYGRAYIRSNDMSTGSGRARKYISYSPSTSSINPHFTVCEMLKLFFLLQAIDHKQILNECENLARIMGIYPYFHKRLINCSFGILMRTHHAIAILSKPDVLCLDLPTAHLDLAASRQLWNILTELRYRNGTTIIFTTAIPSECERYCSKMAIMQNGRFDSIGTPFEVSRKHPVGFCLYAMFNRTQDIPAKTFLNFTTFMDLNFPASVLREYYCQTAVYYIPHSTNIATIIETIKPKLLELDLETFFVTCETLTFFYLDSLENEKFDIARRLRELSLEIVPIYE